MCLLSEQTVLQRRTGLPAAELQNLLLRFLYRLSASGQFEELEQERLPYWELGNMNPQDPKAELRENLWDKIISGCDLVDTV